MIRYWRSGGVHIWTQLKLESLFKTCVFPQSLNNLLNLPYGRYEDRIGRPWKMWFWNELLWKRTRTGPVSYSRFPLITVTYRLVFTVRGSLYHSGIYEYLTSSRGSYCKNESLVIVISGNWEYKTALLSHEVIFGAASSPPPPPGINSNPTWSW